MIPVQKIVREELLSGLCIRNSKSGKLENRENGDFKKFYRFFFQI